jgi:nucleotide-binding universal stress UspA family protein
VAKVADRLGESRPASVTIRAVNGIPTQVLIEASRDADQMVVGSRGSGGFARLLLGSVSNQLVQHSHSPVTVVREDR